MKNFKNIQTLIFDFGGVLIDLDLDQCIQNFKKLGIDRVEQYLSNFGQSGLFMQLEKGEITADAFRLEVKKMTAIPISDAEIDQAWNSFLIGIPVEKLDLLMELRKKFRVILLSNTNAIHFPHSVDSYFLHNGRSIKNYFDKCYLSYEMKMVKPNADIFEQLLSEEQIAPEHCLFLDDGAKNIEQAQKLGIQTYLVESRENLGFLLNETTFSHHS